MPQISATAILNGGVGNDAAVGGRGDDILLGGPGSDLLLGSAGRDLLIGGEDQDLAIGGAGDDLVIGGSTAHDGNEAALLQILAEWRSADAYAARIQKLRTGAGGLPILDATTVLDDAARDLLVGEAGQEWFFAGPADLLPGRQAAEQVN